ncbi:MAG: hypothetical protein OXH19_01415 [Chloroflexi bacterium]|nr:hypothetical protein [Chloroflexota bacterium]MCY3589697.1 hypothetical protein [Chloroflexota bacterium]MCY3685126.1 hypothetical protein [Chloroflexota bacterium]MDE2707780.1 hypothetical protein [Chloroflexota bacterium]
MRVLSLIVLALIIALGSVLAACRDDGQQQQEQQLQQQQAPTEQQDASAQQRAAPQQASEAEQESRTEEAEEADEPTQAQSEPAAEAEDVDPLFAAARSAFEAWAADLDSWEMAIDVDLNLGGLSAQVVTTVAVQLEPYMALATIDASSLFEVAGELAGDAEAELDEPLLMRVLIGENAAYLSMPEMDGWIDLSDQFDEALDSLSALLGANPTELADRDQLGQTFGCVDVVGGTTTEGQHAGEPVWLVECTVDVDTLDESAAQQLQEWGIDARAGEIDSMQLRLTISQASGAPLLVETEARLQDAFGLSGDDSDDANEEPAFYVSTVANLLSWNEPIEFPAPEPLIDGSFLEPLGDFDDDSGSEDYSSGDEPPELLSPEQLLDLAASWVDSADDLHVQFVAQAAIDGEARLASTIVRSSRVVGAFETTVNIDGASTFRLLWNRDGIWTSDVEEDGQPIWTPSSPALLGFSEATVDEFLRRPDRFNLEPLKLLLDISWVTRTTGGGGPTVYELVIESGPLTADDDLFAQVAGILKADMAELLAESVTITSIEYYSTVLTLVGSDGELTNQQTTAEFQTSAGPVELAASLHVIGDGSLQFSLPTR